METKVLIILLGFFVGTRGNGVATSHQSIISGEGWRYGYAIAHGPHGYGHAVGESFPHGYGGFGTYAPAYGYGVRPQHVVVLPPPRPVYVQVPKYIIPYQHQRYQYGSPYALPYGYQGLHGYHGYGYGYNHIPHGYYRNNFYYDGLAKRK